MTFQRWSLLLSSLPIEQLPTVFISYSREDSGFVEAFREGLEVRKAARIVGDFNEIDYSEDWKARLSALIASAETIFFIVSPSWCASPMCRWELETAVAAGVAITPIFFRSTSPLTPPKELAARQGPRVEAFGAAYEPAAAARASLKRALEGPSADASAIAKARADWETALSRFTERSDSSSAMNDLLDLAVKAIAAPSRLWRRRRAQWAQRAERWTEHRAADRLLRPAEISELQTLLDQTPDGENSGPSLLVEYLQASRDHETRVAEDRRRVIARAFVDPARRQAEDGNYDAALRRVGAAALFADDPDLALDLATPEPHTGALWTVAAKAALLTTDWAISVPQTGTGPAAEFQQSLSGVRPALSPDGSLLVVASGHGGFPRVYRTRDHQEIAVLEYDAKWISSAIWPSRASHFFTTAGNYQITAWDGNTLARIETPNMPRLSLHPHQVSADGTLMVDHHGAMNHEAPELTECWRWSRDGAELVSSFPGKSGMTAGCAISPDGRFVASPGEDGATWIWTAANGKPVSRLQRPTGMHDTPFGPSDHHSELFFTPSNEFLVAKSYMHGVTTWRLEPEPQPTRWPDGDYDFICGLSDELCIAATKSGDVTIRDVATGKEREAVLSCGSKLRHLSVSASGGLLAAGCADCTAKVKRRDRDPIVSSGVAGGLSPLTCFASASFRIIGIDPADGTIGLFDCETNAILWRTAAFPGESSRDLLIDVSVDRRCAVLARDGLIRIVNLADGRTIAEHGFSGRVRSLCLSPTGTAIVISDRENELTRSYDVATFESGTVYYPGDRIVADALCFSPDGSVLFQGVADKRLIAHDSASGEKIRDFGATDVPIDKVVAADDGSFVLAAHANGSAEIFDCRDGRRLSWPSLGDLAMTGSAGFWPDGGKAFLMPTGPTATSSGAVFDVETGAMLHRIPRSALHGGYAAVSRDGDRMLVTSLDGRWQVHDTSWLSAFEGNRATYLAAALNHGVGLRTNTERKDILLSTAPDDIFAAYIELVKRSRTAGLDVDDIPRVESEIDDEIERASRLIRERWLPREIDTSISTAATVSAAAEASVPERPPLTAATETTTSVEAAVAATGEVEPPPSQSPSEIPARQKSWIKRLFGG